MKRALMISAMVAFCVTGAAIADTEENADDFMQIHKIEIVFHHATPRPLDRPPLPPRCARLRG